MFYFKACPKCSGDLHFERDVYGAFFKCFQCGRIVEAEAQEPTSDKKTARRVEKLAA